jgi:hypothetical protein
MRAPKSNGAAQRIAGRSLLASVLDPAPSPSGKDGTGLGDRGSRSGRTPRPVRFRQPACNRLPKPFWRGPDQGDYEQHQKNQEQNSRHTRRRHLDSSKTEERSNEGDDKENDGPVEHDQTLPS